MKKKDEMRTIKKLSIACWNPHFLLHMDWQVNNVCAYKFTLFPIPVMIAITRMLRSYMASIRAPQMTSACG
jgi:hypothetical protein